MCGMYLNGIRAFVGMKSDFCRVHYGKFVYTERNNNVQQQNFVFVSSFVKQGYL